MSVKPPFTKGGGGLIIGQLFRAGRKLVWLGTVSTLTTTRRKKKKKKKKRLKTVRKKMDKGIQWIERFYHC